MWTDSEVAARLRLKYPIIQGPFGGGLSTKELVVAVSNAGGLGSFGAHLLSPDEIETLVADIRQETARPFAINLWVSNADPGMNMVSVEAFEARRGDYRSLYESLGAEPPEFSNGTISDFERQAEAILRARPEVMSFVFGIPSQAILAECRKRGIVTIGAATSIAEALAIEGAGADMLVATGFEAGGHRPTFLGDAEDSLAGTLALVPQVRDQVRIPVIAAGGIADSRGVAAAFALGADAVQLGTAFLACRESGASQVHRDELFSARERRSMLSRGFTGRLARYQSNRFLEAFEAAGAAALPYPAQSWLTAPIKRSAAQVGDAESLALYASQAAPLVRHRTVPELMASLVEGLGKKRS